LIGCKSANVQSSALYKLLNPATWNHFSYIVFTPTASSKVLWRICTYVTIRKLVDALYRHLARRAKAVAMSFVFRLEDYPRYLERAGGASYIDVTRRTDPARIQRVWDNLEAVVNAYAAPWVVQLWTKDAAGTLARGGALLRRLQREGTTLAAQVTVTGLGGTAWEPLAPAEPFAGVADLIALAGGPDHVKWRYDPVLPTVRRVERFRRLAGQAAALGISLCVVNFVASSGHYKRVDARLAAALPGWSEGMPGYDDEWRAETAAELVATAGDAGLSVATCAESAGLVRRVPGLQPAICGDHSWFVSLSGRDPGRAPTIGSRPGCGCAAYFDVGLYGQWPRCHRCLYCYAG
jgi:hypothetical protein